MQKNVTINCKKDKTIFIVVMHLKIQFSQKSPRKVYALHNITILNIHKKYHLFTFIDSTTFC